MKTMGRKLGNKLDIFLYIDEAARNAKNTNHTMLRLAVQAGLPDTIFSYRQRQNRGDLPETSGFRNRMLSLLTKNENVKENTERRKILTHVETAAVCFQS